MRTLIVMMVVFLTDSAGYAYNGGTSAAVRYEGLQMVKTKKKAQGINASTKKHSKLFKIVTLGLVK